uniref:Battenin n=1 Tax=Acrobeloides nanus TaxID=290746 RepID=A0A914E016_9BILA
MNWVLIRNFAAFWIFGLANNYAYVIMLSSAEDIMDKQQNKNDTYVDKVCEEEITTRHCSTMSTGAVLLADILPTLLIKATFPFFLLRVPFGIRHLIVCLLQIASYFVVAFSVNVAMSLSGVILASAGAGLGELSYLALSSHFSNNMISAWSSGTGGAGIFGSLAYAGLTEPHLADLSPKTALLVMLIVPIIFAIAYWFLMVLPPSVHTVNIIKPKTWLNPKIYPETIKVPPSPTWSEKSSPDSDIVDSSNTTIPPLLPYMIPLAIVYIGEYIINQGLTELIFFNCSHGFSLSRKSQYRWYQVLYQLGVFISRSSVNVIELPRVVLYILPVLQMLNAIFFFFNAIYWFIPHISIVFVLIIFEGLLGGASYVNTFNRIHKEVSPDVKEYCLSIASIGDSIGIVIAGFGAIPIHNIVCNKPLYSHV